MRNDIPFESRVSVSRRAKLLLAAAILSFTANVQGAVITFQNGASPTGSYTGSSSSYIRNDLTSQNNGSGITLLMGRTAADAILRGVFSFNLSAIPAGATITSVTLTLVQTADGTSVTGGNSVDVFTLTNPFTESQVTWDNRTTSNLWTTPGGDIGLLASNLAAISATSSATRVFPSSSNFVTAAQNAFSSSQTLNLLIKLNSETTNGTRLIYNFASDENATVSSRPLLTVNYTPVPEPSAVSFLLAGLACTVFFRRRASDSIVT